MSSTNSGNHKNHKDQRSKTRLESDAERRRLVWSLCPLRAAEIIKISVQKPGSNQTLKDADWYDRDVLYEQRKS